MADTVPGDPRNLRKSILNVFVLLILIYGFFSGVCAVVVSGHVVEEVLRLVIVAVHDQGDVFQKALKIDE